MLCANVRKRPGSGHRVLVGWGATPWPYRITDNCAPFLQPISTVLSHGRVALLSSSALRVAGSILTARDESSMPNDADRDGTVPDWWKEEEAFDAMADAARDEQFFSEQDAHIADIHEWLEAKYRARYRPRETEVCLEAVLACQEGKAPLPNWLVEALKEEIALALRRPVAWDKLEVAAREANRERQEDAARRRDWYWRQAEEMHTHNPALSASRIADLISARAEGTEFAAAPTTIRHHLKGFLAEPSKRGQT